MMARHRVITSTHHFEVTGLTLAEAAERARYANVPGDATLTGSYADNEEGAFLRWHDTMPLPDRTAQSQEFAGDLTVLHDERTTCQCRGPGRGCLRESRDPGRPAQTRSPGQPAGGGPSGKVTR